MASYDRLCCIDFETTRDTSNDLHIIELAAVRLSPELLPDKHFSSLVRPPCRMHPVDINVTGLTDNTLAKAEELNGVIHRFFSFVDDAVVIAHNAVYDRKVVEVSCKRLGIQPPDWNYVDTLRLAKKNLQCKKYSLDALLEHIGTPSSSGHRALADCRSTSQLFRHIVHELAKAKGQSALQYAIETGRLETESQLGLF